MYLLFIACIYTSSVGKIHDPYVQAGGCWRKGPQHSAQSAQDSNVGLVWKHILPRAWACTHRYHQECGTSHKQQGRVPLHPALSLPPWPVAAVRTAAGRNGWAGWGLPTTIGSKSNGKGLDRWQKFQHFLCAILHYGPWWTGTICMCVLRWGFTSMDMLITY